MNLSARISFLTAFALIGFAFISTSRAAQTQPAGCAGKKLCIGVRSDARPFSYAPDSETTGRVAATDGPRGPLTRAGYTGYMIQICDAVLAEMVLESESDAKLEFGDIGIYDIDDNRTEQSASRFDELGVKFDILCDPATITNERRVGLTVSPPLFVTGISYITLKGLPLPKSACIEPERPLIGMVGGTTAESYGIRALVDAGEMPKYEEELIKYLRSAQTCSEAAKPRVQAYATHSAAAMAFCNKDFHYYVGDLEIITENTKAIPGCAYENGTQTYTNDRYAIFGKSIPQGDEEITLRRKLLLARFFKILSQKTLFTPSLLDKAFSDTFQNVKPSQKLEIFLWSIRGAGE